MSVYLFVLGVEVIVVLDHTRTHKLGRTPVDEGSNLCRYLYLTTHNTHKRQASISPAGFEPTRPKRERPQAHALDHAVTQIGLIPSLGPVYNTRCFECLYLFIHLYGYVYICFISGSL
jgi:hypothetical protein